MADTKQRTDATCAALCLGLADSELAKSCVGITRTALWRLSTLVPQASDQPHVWVQQERVKISCPSISHPIILIIKCVPSVNGLSRTHVSVVSDQCCTGLKH